MEKMSESPSVFDLAAMVSGIELVFKNTAELALVLTFRLTRTETLVRRPDPPCYVLRKKSGQTDGAIELECVL